MKTGHLVYSILFAVCVFCVVPLAAAEQEGSLRLDWKEFEGKSYVSSESMKQAGIEVKNLPGERKLAVCTSNQCIVVSDFVADRENIWIGSAALGVAGIKFRGANGKWRISLAADRARESGTQVGSFAPEVRFALLDGRTMRLGDFAGKRVLINNWASW